MTTDSNNHYAKEDPKLLRRLKKRHEDVIASGQCCPDALEANKARLKQIEEALKAAKKPTEVGQ